MRHQIVLDTNLLILLVVGETDPSLIAKFKRTVIYSTVDLQWLQSTIKQSAGLLLCPNVVTETSNLIGRENSWGRRFSSTLKATIHNASETYIASTRAADEALYRQLGITDAVLAILARTDAWLITDDLALALAAQRISANVTNYNHVRAHRMGGN